MCIGCGCALDDRTPGCRRCTTRHWNRKQSKERKSVWNAKFHREHREQRIAAMKHHRRPQWNAAYYQRNRDRRDALARLYRLRRRAQFVETVERAVLFERDRGLCGICGDPVDPGRWDIDHIVPISLGGVHSYGNTQVSHSACNRAKGVSARGG